MSVATGPAPDLDFDGTIGIDWSGAAQAGYAGVAVARCRPGRAAPELVAPPGRAARWTRQAVLDWLLAEPLRQGRWLIGFGFAFVLPDTGLPAAALWAAVEARCADAPDLLGSGYVAADPRFWTAGRRPSGWVAPQRPAERACAEAGLGHPQSPLQLIGAKQVGKGSLAGMRLLHRLHRAQASTVAIWPFEPLAAGDRRSVCVEIYPRLFIRRAFGDRAGLRNAKLTSRDDLNWTLNGLASIGSRLERFDDHQADALVSAAGLRLLATDPAVWAAGAGEPEGWIFGVPRPAGG